MGIRQEVRHSTLTAVFTGSNPVCPVGVTISKVHGCCYPMVNHCQIPARIWFVTVNPFLGNIYFHFNRKMSEIILAVGFST